MLNTGISGEETIPVTEANTAKALGSGSLEVFATPAMIALIEKTARNSISSALEEGQTTVGTSLNVQHLAATPMGMQVTAKTTLVEVDRRRLVFSAAVYDETGLIGKGTHERFVVDADKFQAKTNAKAKSN